MFTLPLLATILRETFSSQQSRRIPEPDLIMDNPAKVEAFRQAGSEHGILSSVYLFHCAQISEVIKPGDTVLDLGCGPCNQLGVIARHNPDVNFIGVDLSDEMLARAEEHLRKEKLSNVTLRKDDITRLDSLADKSVDAVYSTVVLHHLPTEADLEAAFAQTSRVLREDGGLYLVDFAHLKSEKSIQYFAYRDQFEQPELFTLDYLYSLRAAFPLTSFSRDYQRHLKNRGHLYAFKPMPYMVAIKSAPRRNFDPALTARLRETQKSLKSKHHADLKNIMMLFRLSGLKSPYLS